MTETEPPKNPYASMKDGELKSHWEQMKSIISSKESTIPDFAAMTGGNKLTVEQQQKLDEHDKFSETMSKIEAIFKDKESGEVKGQLSETDKRLADSVLATTIDKISSINADVPVSHIVGSTVGTFDKIDKLSSMIPVMKYYEDTIATLKTQIPQSEEGSISVKDGFSQGAGKYSGMLKMMQKVANPPRQEKA